MARITCPACSAEISAATSVCPSCGKPLQTRDAAPVSHLGGKLQVIGTLILAGGIIATLTGGWWGPALLFPGLVIFILGRFW